MKFLKVNPDRAVNVKEIAQLYVGGREDNATLEAELKHSDSVILSRHRSFREAEIAMLELVNMLERS